MHLKISCVSFCLLLSIFWCSAQSSGKFLITRPLPDGTIYFIVPSEFPAQNEVGPLKLDFTYFHPAEPSPDSDTVVVNGSIYTRTPVKEITSIIFLPTAANPIKPLDATQILYIEQVKGKWHSRFSTRIRRHELMQLLSMNSGVQIEIVAEQRTRRYVANSKWYKRARTLSPILSVEFR